MSKIRDIRILARRQDERARADVPTETVEKFRDAAAARGATASREHYDAILDARSRHAARGSR